MPARRPRLAPLAFFLFACLALLPAGLQAQRRGRQVTLPEGKGKEIVETTCIQCHGADRVAGDGYTRADWIRVIGTMVELPADQLATVADYLAKNFPERPKPKPVLIPGPASVSFREWSLPTKGSRPRQPTRSRKS